VQIYGGDVPPGIPEREFVDLDNLAGQLSAVEKNLGAGALAGFRGLIYRTKAADLHELRFTDLMKLSGPATLETVFLRDQEWFEFVVCCTSAIECLFYAIYHLAVKGLKKPKLTLNTPADLRKVNPKFVFEKLRLEAPKDPLIEEMSACTDAAEWILLDEQRTMLFHRGAPPKSHFVGGLHNGKSFVPSNVKELPADWAMTMLVDPGLAGDLAAWRRKAIQALLLAATNFFRRYPVL
jgi:hypothetical protein